MSLSSRATRILARIPSMNSKYILSTFSSLSFPEKKLAHYANPRNVGSFDMKDPSVGTGIVGASPCGDILKLQIKVDSNTGKIIDARFQMYGCGCSIACCSYSTEWLKGKSVDDASVLEKTGISNALQLPAKNLHCSSLTEDSIHAALNNYRMKLQKEASLNEE